MPRLAIEPASSAFSCSRRAISRAIDRVTRSSGERCIRRSVSRARSSGNTFRNGDCSSATASATLSAPSNTGSPVVFSKSARTMVSRSVNVRGAGRDEERRGRRPGRRRRPPSAAPATHHGVSAGSRGAAATQRRCRGRVRCSGRLAAISSADAGRSRGSGESACMTTRSSCGLTFGDQRRRPRRQAALRRLDRTRAVRRAARTAPGRARRRRSAPRAPCPARAARAPCSPACPSACASRRRSSESRSRNR